MTHWSSDGGSPWLDEFFGNLSKEELGRIKYLAQHDYSGNPSGIVAKAKAAHKKYGRKIWLTEFAVGNGAARERNDAFLRNALPLLDGSDSIARYAWFSTRNEPKGWVAQSSLLPPVAKGAGEEEEDPSMTPTTTGEIYAGA